MFDRTTQLSQQSFAEQTNVVYYDCKKGQNFYKFRISLTECLSTDTSCSLDRRQRSNRMTSLASLPWRLQPCDSPLTYRTTFAWAVAGQLSRKLQRWVKRVHVNIRLELVLSWSGSGVHHSIRCGAVVDGWGCRCICSTNTSEACTVRAAKHTQKIRLMAGSNIYISHRNLANI